MQTLIDYLQGRVNESASIQYTDEVNRATATGKRQRGPADDSSTEPAAKLAKGVRLLLLYSCCLCNCQLLL